MTSVLTIVANNDILVLETEKTLSHDIKEITEASFNSTEDDNITLPATPPITVSPPVFSHGSFLERTDMTSLSADLLVIRGWVFDSKNDTSRPHFKQTELVRKIEARRWVTQKKH